MKKLLVLLSIIAIVCAVVDQSQPMLSRVGQPLNGMVRATILIYSQPTGGSLVWAGTTDGSLPPLKLANGYIHNIDQVIPGYVRDSGELWIEILVDGRDASGSRIHYTSPELPLRRELPDDPGEIAETLTDELQIGLPGDELYVASATTGFGDDAPVDRVDVDGAIGLKEGTAPVVTTDYGKIYVNDTDGHLYFIDELGNVTDLTVDANAVQSVSSSANHTGRTAHMRFIPGESTEITESATDDTIFVQYNVNVSCDGAGPCSVPPAMPAAIDGAASVCSGEPGTSYGVPPVDGASYYRWTLPDGSAVLSGFGTNVIQAILGYVDGNICVSAVNDCGSSSARCLGVTIERPSSPGSITGPTLVCEDTVGMGYSIDAVPDATNYIWTAPPGAIIASGSGSPSVLVNFGTSGGEVCVQTENYCGRSEAECLTVSMTSVPSTPGVISGTTPVCQAATETYSISSVSGATSYTWTVPSGSTIDAGDGTTSIQVTFGSAGGDVCVSANSICGSSPTSCKAITVNIPPSITSHPSDVAVDEGDPATFTVGASGTSLSYQWQRSTDGGSSWGNVGTSATSYTEGSTTGSMDGYQYRCVVTGACSPSATSTAATLTVSTGLYTFTSHTFNNCGVSGRTGPNISQCRAAYTTSWDDTYLNMTTNGIQRWTVPSTGTYRIEAYGASGGDAVQQGGNGARMRGDFTLTEGEIVQILVGQMGENATNNTSSGASAGGGGATYVIKTDGTRLLIAGGGGGAGVSAGASASDQTGLGGTTSSTGLTGKGTSGSSGGADPNAGAAGSSNGCSSGAGYSGNSAAYSGWATSAYSFTNGGLGSQQTSSTGGDGGFGGGGGGAYGGGGGGGAGGGGCGEYNPTRDQGGGGGGSINSGSNQSNSADVNNGHGYVSVTKL